MKNFLKLRSFFSSTSKQYTADSLTYQKLFQGNEHYIKEKLQENPKYFEELSKGQQPKYLLIGCSDSRVPPNELTKTNPGEIFIHRNIANQVILTDMSVNAVIQFAVQALKVKHIIVMGHSQCGGCKAALESKSHGGILDLWINHVRTVHQKYEKAIDLLPEDKRLDKLIEFNVLEQVQNIWKSPFVQESWSKDSPIWVHGWICRLETGKIEEIVMEKVIPEELRKNYQLDFPQSKHVFKTPELLQNLQRQFEGLGPHH